MSRPIRVLFVCMGNICRSPTAHGVFRQQVQAAGLTGRIAVVSAGTHGYHVGAEPDERSQQHAARRGYDLSDLRGSHLGADDCVAADHVLVMDEANLRDALHVCPPEHAHKLRLLASHARTLKAREVPDPYYGGAAGFERVLDLIEDSCTGLLDALRREHGL
ncbi:low molecular weight protein-tyrosine-phosphatase [Hydrogenophaga electricum]|uniref:protein-tyrosine-phosphatase n=1 Tax=Hydrogenophaga electricum TaxID=1230953 RepID=A0ABQ6C023_9BURK|nr:low molecular weight protein-tyrosine-phosphatase [Hydrogenophaga electricum]GLS13215.1 phosphotyrosine protein phosphatase [Hydrogenophaga electricum]